MNYTIAFFITALLLIILVIKLALYKKEIQNITDQLAYIRKEDTNKLISRGLKDSSISNLTNEINSFIESAKDENRAYFKKDGELKVVITNLSHDIRTPLTSIEGFFQLYTKAEDEEKKEAYKATIQSQLKDLNSMLNSMFFYVKLQNTAIPQKLEIINLREVLFNTLFTFYSEFEKLETSPEIDFKDDNIFIFANMEELERLFENIIKNALVHGDGNLDIIQSKDEDNIYIEFKNPLIEELEFPIEEIFNRFVKGDTARTTRSTGLGLSIVKEIAEKYDGSVLVKNNEGEFILKITLPLYKNH